jgi:uncharacterized protein YodC (DUF2158 family)
MNVGNVVILKSGGPKMTITAVRHADLGDIAFCKWFDELGQLQFRGHNTN